VEVRQYEEFEMAKTLNQEFEEAIKQMRDINRRLRAASPAERAAIRGSAAHLGLITAYKHFLRTVKTKAAREKAARAAKVAIN
jgi:hypothetical protein